MRATKINIHICPHPYTQEGIALFIGMRITLFMLKTLMLTYEQRRNTTPSVYIA